MSATIVFFDGVEATLAGWKWSCANKTWESLLNGSLNPDGPSGSDPDPVGNEARRVAGLLNGRVVRADEPPPIKPGTVL